MKVFVLWIFLITVEVNAKYFLVKKSASENDVMKNNQANDYDYDNDAYRESDESNYYIPGDVEYYLILTF